MNNTELVAQIERLKKEKNAIIMAHYYTRPEVQDIADFVGDSLALAQVAAKTDADIILFAGVNFMAETAKVLCPQKKVLIPAPEASCSLADSCPAEEFEKFVKQYPDHIVVSYVNTSVGVKAVTDIVCTSSNAVKVINSIPEDKPIIFGPDRNLGNYINTVTGRNMKVWDGCCHVHEKFSVERIMELKKENPEAKVVAHPECKKSVLNLADFVGSTAAILDYVKKDEAKEFIVATEVGILHKMQEECGEKRFIPAPPEDDKCGCNNCDYMKMVTLENIFETLKNEAPEIILDEKIIERAKLPIVRMLEIF
ncbi:MAG: quinolinate synthase NadA [Rikenellaceae bacterium]|nr:quinolinate synthase NadA [Rikenellaceae bacterium]